MLPGDSKEMNENIKNLWDAALEEFSKQHQFATIMLPAPLREKFARLIVQECLSQVDKIRDGLEADSEDQQALGADWAGLAIARHFGVEE